MPVTPCRSRWSPSSAPTSSPRSIRQPPSRTAGRHAHGAPVGVGVVGDQHVGAALLRQRHRQVHRPRLLGVGEGHRREVRVGLGLLGHDRRRGEAGACGDLDDAVAADAVHRGVDPRHLARPVTRQPRERVEVGLADALVEDLALVAARHRGDPTHSGDPLGDLDVRRRDDLAAVAEVDLVAVVLRRVVARGHHHPGHRAQVPDREGQQGSGQRPREDQRPQSGAGDDLGGVAGEDVGVVAGVVPDDDGVALGRALVTQVGHQARGGAGDDDAVHPHRAGAEGAAQPGGAELQRPGEALGQVGSDAGVARRQLHQLVQLGAGDRVGVVGGPRPGRLQQVGEPVHDVSHD